MDESRVPQAIALRKVGGDTQLAEELVASAKQKLADEQLEQVEQVCLLLLVGGQDLRASSMPKACLSMLRVGHCMMDSLCMATQILLDALNYDVYINMNTEVFRCMPPLIFLKSPNKSKLTH